MTMEATPKQILQWPEAHWLAIVNWREVQKYQNKGPRWIALCTSLVTDPRQRAKWDSGDAAADRNLALVVRLWLFAACNTMNGIVWGDPLFLQEALELRELPNLAPLLAAGLVEYLSDEEAEPLRKADRALRRPHRTRGGGNGDPGGTKAPSRPSREPLDGPTTGGDLTGDLPGDLTGAPAASPCCYQCGAPIRRPARKCRSCKEKTAAARRRRQTSASVRSKPQGQGQGQRTDDRNSTTAKRKPPARAMVDEADPGGVGGGQRDSTATTDNNASTGPPTPSPSTPPPVVQNPNPPRISSACPPLSDPAGPAPKRPQNPSGYGSGPSLLSACLGPYARSRTYPQAREWTEAVFAALRFPFSADSRRGRQEIGCFASLYEDLLGQPLPAAVKAEILEHDLRDAEEKGKKPKQRGSGALFCHIHNSRLADWLARCRAPTYDPG